MQEQPRHDMALMSIGNKFSLYLGYPCSVDAGVNPVAYADMIIIRIKKLREEQRTREAQILRDQLCRLIPDCSMDSTDAKLKGNAEKLRESWGHTVHEDKTMMMGDMKLVANCFDRVGFSDVNKDLNLRVIDEFLDEHIDDVKAFLCCIPDPQNNTIRFLCLCGHGLSEEDAAKLCHNPANGANRSPVWPWELCSCRKTMEQEASVMTRNAKQGDIVVFSSGLLTPKWVIDRLRDCEDNLRSRNKMVRNTIVIVIDACYSGMWKTRMQKCLTTKALKFTRVILQTSCSEDEVSYGCCFIPVFCALQDAETRTKILEAYDNNPNSQGKIDELFDRKLQTPTVYDSEGEVNRDGLPVCEPFHFFSDANFLTFCLKYLTISNLENARGIPNEKLPSFFNSFGSKKSPGIRCFKLKKHSRSGSPLAFFLMEWNEQFYHIHLHFDNFDNMKLTGVSHVNVTEGHYYYDGYWYRYDEDHKTKHWINYNPHDAKWKLVETNERNMIVHCKKFVEQQKKWDKRDDWCMPHAIPRLIRSRSAYFQDTKSECTKMGKFKPLYEDNA